mmetsp:Transcript_41054/g.99532  ORF Transcript_41054/g.99532 Transcript_41054/m.99532 type:complete len:252 (+) Transcript_41054:529-1284(+)
MLHLLVVVLVRRAPDAVADPDEAPDPRDDDRVRELAVDLPRRVAHNLDGEGNGDDEKVQHVQRVAQEEHAEGEEHHEQLDLEDGEDRDGDAEERGVRRVDRGVLVLVAADGVVARLDERRFTQRVVRGCGGAAVGVVDGVRRGGGGAARDGVPGGVPARRPLRLEEKLDEDDDDVEEEEEEQALLHGAAVEEADDAEPPRVAAVPRLGLVQLVVVACDQRADLHFLRRLRAVVLRQLRQGGLRFLFCRVAH